MLFAVGNANLADKRRKMRELALIFGEWPFMNCQ
jgi:hypothetical protein